VQLSQLEDKQLDELALLVSERGVVFFRNQDLTTEQQEKLFAHYGKNSSFIVHNRSVLTEPRYFGPPSITEEQEPCHHSRQQ
jgi:alpha-ketoglutarate-dependent taurine dioxygenase